jgi:hypothetical protein
LDKADLRGANLSNARLAYAAFDDARLDAAILDGVDLRYARGLTQAQIDLARGDGGTVLPPHLSVPGSWLGEEQPEAAQPAEEPAAVVGGQATDPFAALGLAPGASMQEVRAAWRKLVKELHPEGLLDQTPASERLKAVNQAYQRLKDLERHAKQGRAAVGTLRGARAVFAASFLLPVAAAALLMAAQSFFAHPDGVTREETSAVREEASVVREETNAVREEPNPAAIAADASENEPPATHRSLSYANSAPPWTDEPSVAAAERLR